ncbi:MAG: hypothetical protein IJB97_01635, partial [Clostridia bacterium]|nr:hypothetical protein [Clostridia bacterium]
LGTFVPEENENWEGLGYAIGLIYLLVFLAIGAAVGLIQCVLSLITGKKLISSTVSGRVPKVLMIFNGIAKVLNLGGMFLIVVFLTIFPDVLAYIIVSVALMILVVLSIVFDCLVRSFSPKMQEEREKEYPESYGFDNE